MSILVVVLLVLAGIVLLFLEFFVIPGLSIFGIAGFITMIGAVVLSYYEFGAMTGHITLVTATVTTGLFFVFALRFDTWKKLSLKAEIDSSVREDLETVIKIGEKGISISRLAPMGKVMINGAEYEAEARNQIIDENTEVEVVKVYRNKITVKSI